jgi:hypothetical protein
MTWREARGLQPLPPTFAATRDALHRVAAEILAPACKPHNEIALRATPAGFGTPEFDFEGAKWQVRVERANLVAAKGGEERKAPLTTLAAAAEFIGKDSFPDGMPSDGAPLEIDEAAAIALGDWFAFGDGVLSTFREGLPPEMNASDINLWPEHFDVALEAGSEDDGKRANYGASPGDENHAEPYLYVGPWSAPVEGDLWQASGFKGAELTYAELVGAEDQREAAHEFFAKRMSSLEQMEAKG